MPRSRARLGDAELDVVDLRRRLLDAGRTKRRLAPWPAIPGPGESAERRWRRSSALLARSRRQV